MIRLPLGDLEVARRNPVEYRRRLATPQPSAFCPSYFSAVRDAVFRFHRSGGNFLEAREYLTDRLAGFRDMNRRAEMAEQYEWYVEEYIARGVLTFETRLRLVIPPPNRDAGEIMLSGEVSRIDMKPSGGYAAWLFRSREHANWTAEMRMPLIQDQLTTSVLNAGPGEVTIGLYSFEERYVDERCYSPQEIAQARHDLDDLLARLGL